MSKISTVRKAIMAGLTGFSAAFGTAYLDQDMTTGEWVSVGVATVLAAIAVWAVPNAPDIG